MKNKYLIFLLFFIILSSFSILDIFYKKTYIYNNRTEGSNIKTTVLVKKKKNGFVVDKITDDSTGVYVYSPLFSLQQYNLYSPKEDIEVSLILDNKTIVVDGFYKGKKINRKLSINNDWIQDFNFGLKVFLDSKYSEKNFEIVNPKDFSTHELIAIKKGIQKINVNKKTYKTQKVELTLPGFKSLFWRAHIWYDLDTLDLVLYKANEGPGTSESVISLDSNK